MRDSDGERVVNGRMVETFAQARQPASFWQLEPGEKTEFFINEMNVIYQLSLDPVFSGFFDAPTTAQAIQDTRGRAVDDLDLGNGRIKRWQPL